jgi:CheY-like chemotaxis protein
MKPSDLRPHDGPVVLIVENHDDTREMLNKFLSMYGCRVFEAADGARAVLMAKMIGPDLILLDMRIPVLDGIAVTRLIRSNEAIKDVMIVAVTGDARPQLEAEVLRAGCNQVFTKPLDLGRLEDLINRLVLSSKGPAPSKRYPLAVCSRASANTRYG